MNANRTHAHFRNLNLLVGALVLMSTASSIAEVDAVGDLRMSRDGVLFADFATQDMGQTTVGDTTRMVIVLRNIGDEDIFFTDDPPISLGGAQATQFTLIQPALEAGGKLSPNGSTAMAIDYSPVVATPFANTQVFMQTSDGLHRFYVRASAVEAPQPDEPEPNVPGEEPNEPIDENDPNTVDVVDPNTGDFTDPNTLNFVDPNEVNDNDEPNVYEETAEPNDIQPDYNEFDPNDTEDGDYANDRHEEERYEDGEPAEYLDEADVLLSSPFCGFGAAFASMASLASLGGMKRRRSLWK
ncbi:MAG: hypothetical protein KDA32_11885 [Phycisphaerales bacterium]|nr:hypothetical protein [Phycisphaerales bacterium]